MTVDANPVDALGQREMSLAALLSILAPHGNKSLVFADIDGNRVRAGFHVTEVKSGSFVTVDCGGKPDAWRETVLQVEDLPAESGGSAMSVGTFQAIIGKVDRTIQLDRGSRLTIEVSRPGEPMRVHDVAAVELRGDEAIVRLGYRPAICKPRHRAMQSERDECCSSGSAEKGCCS